jgi:cell fate (sporulation/competence/biofilm development) regulator YlbF (YheA/YmcA/DUF963 family)
LACKREHTLQIVEETFIDLLGSEATKTIFNYLCNHYHLNKEDIPLKMGEFQNHLEKILGEATKLIMKKIEERISQP